VPGPARGRALPGLRARAEAQVVEGVSRVGLPPARLMRSSRTLKRAFGVGDALDDLLPTAPLRRIVVRIRRALDAVDGPLAALSAGTGVSDGLSSAPRFGP